MSTGEGGAAAVERYLANVPEPARTTLQKVREAIRSVVPAETVEVISYGMPTFRLQKKGLVAFGAFSKHCSLFPMSGGVIDSLSDELKDYQTSKGTIRFPLDTPLPRGLVEKIVKARLAEIAAKTGSVRGT